MKHMVLCKEDFRGKYKCVVHSVYKVSVCTAAHRTERTVVLRSSLALPREECATCASKTIYGHMHSVVDVLCRVTQGREVVLCRSIRVMSYHAPMVTNSTCCADSVRQTVLRFLAFLKHVAVDLLVA